MGDISGKCPKCGAPWAQGTNYCESCGARMFVGGGAGRLSPCPEGDGGSTPQGGGCATAPFEFSVAKPAAMLEGRRSVVYVRFRAKSDIYDSVEFVLRNESEILSRRTCCVGRPLSSAHTVAFEVVPSRAGVAGLAVDIACRMELSSGESEEIHSAFFDVPVDERTAVPNVHIDINQTQTSDRAGDTKGGDVNVNLGSLSVDGGKSLDGSRYETNPGAFQDVPVRLLKSPPRLTLKSCGMSLQLFSEDLVAFGRATHNDVVLRICGPDGVCDAAANEYDGGYRLSRHHFAIERAGRKCVVHDGRVSDGGRSASAYGTRLGGVRVPPASCAAVPPGRDTILSAGPEDAPLEMDLFYVCDGMGRPSGVSISRRDGAKQRILIVWREVRISGRDTVVWTGGSWALESEDGPPAPLSIGSSVTIGGETFVVLPFHQTCV